MSFSNEQIADAEYQMALTNFNEVIRADPILHALSMDLRAWGDIMYEEDQRNNPEPTRETIPETIARLGINAPVEKRAPAPPAGGEPQFRRWNAEPRTNSRPPLYAQRQNAQRQPAPVAQRQPAAAPPKQQKRPRNSFAALDTEDSE